MDEWMKRAQRSVGSPSEPGDFAFPATKGQIVDQARRNHLPPDVINKLEKLPDKQYNNISDLISNAVKDDG